jgi:hypothetical protein
MDREKQKGGKMGRRDFLKAASVAAGILVDHLTTSVNFSSALPVVLLK